MQIVIELLQGTACCSFSAGVDAPVVLKVVLAVLESKEKREKKRSEKFSVCDVMVGGSCCVRRSPMQCQWCQWCQWRQWCQWCQWCQCVREQRAEGWSEKFCDLMVDG
jgi:hypothetical protein